MKAVDIDDLGIPAVMSSVVPAEHADRVAAALDYGRTFRHGDPLPPLWHWTFFTPTAPTAELGHDGHPRLPAASGTAGLPRRMFAGGRMRWPGRLRVGVEAECHAAVVSAGEKAGRSGRLLVVTVRYTFHQDCGVAVEEEQDLIYREPAAQPVPLPSGAHQAPAPDGGWREDVLFGRVALFRFSAVTFNAHRIHYDGEYARDVEGYPRLIVHGPLVALRLAQSAQSRLGEDLSAFAFRATAPLFEGVAFSVVGQIAAEGSAEVTAIRNDGQVAMRATAVA